MRMLHVLDLEKSKEGLTPKKVSVTRKGKRITTTVYVKADKEKEREALLARRSEIFRNTAYWGSGETATKLKAEREEIDARLKVLDFKMKKTDTKLVNQSKPEGIEKRD